jgi:hypothetical protein
VVDVDKAKSNNYNLTGVIVKVNQPKMKSRVVVKAGLLKPWYNYPKLSRVSGPGNNIKLLGLTDAFTNWQTMKVISERKSKASRKESFVGGQGKGTVICTCKGSCDSNKCKCFKAEQICLSACHHNNAKCKNHGRGN